MNKTNITVVIKCSKDIPFHASVEPKNQYRCFVDDNLDKSNIEHFQENIMHAVKFLATSVRKGKTVLCAL